MSVPGIILRLVERGRTGGFRPPPMPDDLHVFCAIRVFGHAVNQVPPANILGLRHVFGGFVHSKIPAHHLVSDRRIRREPNQATHVQHIAADPVGRDRGGIRLAVVHGIGQGLSIFNVRGGTDDIDGTVGDPLRGIQIDDGPTSSERVAFGSGLENQFVSRRIPLLHFAAKDAGVGIHKGGVQHVVFVAGRGVRVAHIHIAGVEDIVVALRIIVALDPHIKGLVLSVGIGVHLQ